METYFIDINHGWANGVSRATCDKSVGPTGASKEIKKKQKQLPLNRDQILLISEDAALWLFINQWWGLPTKTE